MFKFIFQQPSLRKETVFLQLVCCSFTANYNNRVWRNEMLMRKQERETGEGASDQWDDDNDDDNDNNHDDDDDNDDNEDDDDNDCNNVCNEMIC